MKKKRARIAATAIAIAIVTLGAVGASALEATQSNDIAIQSEFNQSKQESVSSEEATTSVVPSSESASSTPESDSEDTSSSLVLPESFPVSSSEIISSSTVEVEEQMGAVPFLLATGRSGAVNWELSEDGTLTFLEGGTLENTSQYSPTSWASVAKQIKKIVFTAPVKTQSNATNFFYNLSALESFEGFEYFNTEDTNKMATMFSGCSSLTELNFGENFNTSKVITMSNMFADCSSLTKINFGENFNTSKVQDMTSLFGGCKSLSSVNLEQLNTESVTTTAYMFNGCSSLTSINLDSLNFSNITNMSAMFSSCLSLSTLTFNDNCDTSKVTDMSMLFFDCPNLESIDFGNSFTTMNATSFFSMFYGCNNLNTLDLGNNFNTAKVTNMSYMFYQCVNLSSLDLGSTFDTSSVTTMDNMFYKCSSLEKLNLGDKFTGISLHEINDLFSYCTSLPTIDLGDKFDISNVTKINNMFYYCTSLTNLNLGDNFNTGNVTAMVSIFFGCSSLEAIDLGDKFDTSNTTLMLNIFSSCTSLESLNLGDKFDTSNVSNMSSMFSNCTSLTALDLGDKFDTSATTIMSSLFLGCNSLKSLDLGEKFNTSSATDMSGMFYGCSELRTLTLPAGFTFANSPSLQDQPLKFSLVWKDISTGKAFSDSDNFMADYNGATDAGTYTREFKVYDITYELDGGINNSGNPTTYTYSFGTSDFEDATKTGYTFDGWYKDDQFQTKIKSISEQQVGDVTLYAKFEPKKYNIIYELNGGTNSTSNPSTYTYGVGVTSFSAAEKTGYNFDGWYADANLTQEVVSINDTQLEEVTLYAKYSPKVYTITYALDGGTNSANNPVSYTYTIGTDSLEPATKKGHTFAAWYIDSDFKTKVTKISTTQIEDVTLYAKYEVNLYNVSFDYNNGNGSKISKVAYGSLVSEPTDAKLYGYKVVGWTDKEGNYWNFQQTTMPDEDIELSAVWEREEYTLTYETYDLKNLSTYTLYADDKIPTEAPPSVPGHHFVGWVVDGTDIRWDFNNPMPDRSMTLVAIYDKDEEVLSGTDKTKSKNSSPKTGDSTNISSYIGAFSISILALFTLILLILKKKKNNEE